MRPGTGHVSLTGVQRQFLAQLMVEPTYPRDGAEKSVAILKRLGFKDATMEKVTGLGTEVVCWDVYLPSCRGLGHEPYHCDQTNHPKGS